MRVAIMQPTYLPWSGYFALIDQVDVFIFLDDVQFDHRSWQQRNRIKSHDGHSWLTVPVITKGRRQQLINQVEISSDESWQKKHLLTICRNYAKAPWLSKNQDWLEAIYGRQWFSLNQLNVSIIKNLSEFLGIDASFIFSSDLETSGKNVAKLINICHVLHAKEYLSPIGSFEYIEASNVFHDVGIQLLYQQYKHPIYHQLHGEFLSHMSVIDLLLNEGPRSLEIVRSGLGTPYTSEELRRLYLLGSCIE